jgi:hypothetical protein
VQGVRPRHALCAAEVTNERTTGARKNSSCAARRGPASAGPRHERARVLGHSPVPLPAA